MIDNYYKNNNISKASLILNSIKYCIDNNIDVFTAEQKEEENKEE